MRIKINTNGNIESNIKKFLKWTDSSFVDVYISEYILYMVIESTEQSAVYPAVVLEQDDYTDDVFIRVDKIKLYNLLIKGSLEFVIDSKITLYFYNEFDTEEYSLRIPKQTMDVRAVRDAVNIVLDTKNYDPITNPKASTLARIGRNLRQPVSISNNIGVVRSPSVIVYQQIKSDNITLSADVFYKMCSETGSMYHIGNRIVLTAENGVNYIARKIRGIDLDDFNVIIKAPAQYYIECNMSMLISLIKKADLRIGNLVIDFSDGSVVIEDEEYHYESSIVINKIESHTSGEKKKPQEDIKKMDFNTLLEMNKGLSLSSKKTDLEPIKFNNDIVKYVLPVLPDLVNVGILVKRNFIVLKSKDIFVVFRRESNKDGKTG